MERDTRQRRAIRLVFETSGRPLSTQEVLSAAHRHAPSLGLATVYRNVKALVEEGWLVAVELPGEAARYEPAGKRHHHHFRCRRCDRLYELPDCRTSVARAPKGFVVESHELTLYGRCASCAAAFA
jgi:Fur family transcriptional regulator, ferric uptake regulator